MLTLPRTLTLTPDQFAEVCAANPEAVLELDADGTLIEMTPHRRHYQCTEFGAAVPAAGLGPHHRGLDRVRRFRWLPTS